MTKARTLADFISDGSPLADGTISVSEVSGAAPIESPTFTNGGSGRLTVAGHGITVDGSITLGTAHNIGDTYPEDDLNIQSSNSKRLILDGMAGIRLRYNGTQKVFIGDTETTFEHDAKLKDNKILKVGQNDDLQLYHDSSTTTNKLVGDLTQTGKLTTDATDLSALAATINDTAVDVFVYRTADDSDGGAWRKRTQGTSWYNEALNTATRGSRKEFPSVAVIVATETDLVIYDGDDPSLPMWIELPNAALGGTRPIGGVFALNGDIAAAQVGGINQNGLIAFNFIEDKVRHYGAVTGSSGYANTDGVRGDGNYFDYDWDNSLPNIVNASVNDVAMTVLPNAPIDAATGLPVPTIAIASDGGVSVIKDDGTVVDVTGGIPNSISFTKENRLFFDCDIAAGGSRAFRVLDIPSVDTNLTLAAKPAGSQYYTTAIFADTYPEDISFLNGYAAKAVPNAIGFRTGTSHLALIAPKPDDNTKAMIAFVTSDYNTGWQNGAIKLATLSDTDDTDVTGSELVTNGTFDTDTTGWTASAGFTLAQNAGVLDVSYDGVSGLYYVGGYQVITTVVGKTYVVSAEVTAVDPSSSARVRIEDNLGSGQHLNTNIAVGSYTWTFTASSTATYINLALQANVSGTVSFDNISVRLAEADRSVNGNGLQVFGTVTKNPVATGADLVGYSNASASDYLFQPYNSDLDFAGDFALTFWAKSNTTAQHTFFARQIPTTGSNSYGSTPYIFAQSNSSNTLSWYYRGTSSSGNYVSSATIRDNNWHHFCLMRSGGTMYAYIDGKLDGSFSFSESFANTSAPFFVGIHSYNNTLFRPLSDGGISLFRISATAPSPEQIAKIYEDEKVLFTEGSQATLYGSSDAVTALAYDGTTELLHVGTSEGRSDFQGLRRVNNTTNAVGAAISASNGMIVEE